MTIPEPFLPMRVENDNVKAYRNFAQQMSDYAQQSNLRDRRDALLAQYQKHPWLSPGVATSYVKWKEQVGPHAAKSLAREAFDATQYGANKADVRQDLDAFIATKDFQRQVKAFRDRQEDDGGSIWGSVMDRIPVVGAVKGLVEGKSLGEVLLRSVPGAKLASDIDTTALSGTSHIPGVGQPIKTGVRAGFTALESPYQELQAGAMSALTGLIGPVGDQAQPARPGSEASRLGAASGSPQWEPTSSGAFALRGLSTGSGFFPGGEAEKAHERAVRNIASLTYGGQQHFATPGRLFASTVTEPGTDPFNVLSGSIDALAIIKSDPANLALGSAAELNKARKGFDTANEVRQAGGLWGDVRAFVHGPTKTQWLDNPNKGGAFVAHTADNFAGRPDMLNELGRRTGWKWPAEVYRGIIEAPSGDRDAVRGVLEPALGTSIDQQPALNSFAASIKNTTHQRATFSELPQRGINFSDLDNSSEPLREFHNYLLGIGLNDREASRAVSGILTAHGRAERSEAVFAYFRAERDALVKKGVPQNLADRWSQQAFGEVREARTYFDGQINDGAYPPGFLIDGEAYPADKPFLVSEHLGDRVELPPLTGKNGRGQLLARHGNLFGIVPGTAEKRGETVLDPQGVPVELEGPPPGKVAQALHQAGSGIYRANSAGIHMQNVAWKPLALIRGAWTLRVIGEEQVRMAMAGYDSMINHPLSYIAMHAAKKTPENVAELKWAAEQRAMRHAVEGAFGYNNGYRRLIGKGTETYAADRPEFAKAWADKLTRYSEDPAMHGLAEEVVKDRTGTTALDAMRQRLWDGDLAATRADLSESKALLDAGIDMSRQEGVDRYIREAYARLHYYTQGDGDLINTIAKQKYTPSPASLGKGATLKDRQLLYDGEPVTVVAHSKGNQTAQILMADGNVRGIKLNQLTLPEGAEGPTKLLTQTEDGIRLDEQFAAHLGSKVERPAEVSANVARLTPERQAWYDRATRAMFAGLMDKPTTNLNRSHVFLEAHLNEMERLLPSMTADAQREALADARSALLQAHETGIRHPIQTLQHPLEAALKGRYAQLETAATRGTGKLSLEEADVVAKGHALDDLRTLLYDTHKRNKTLASMQLVAPFGEAWKEMLGSWGRIIAERPQTIRKVQIAVTAAKGANPFAMLPGAVPDYYADKGFFYKNDQGKDQFFYPYSLPFNEAMTGVSMGESGDPMSLSMGFNLIPGAGPGLQLAATTVLNKYLDDPKWDPIRRAISPYGSPDLSEGFGSVLEETFAPAWAKKVLLGWTANPKGTNQDAKAMGSIQGDVISSGAASGEYDMNSKEGIRFALKDSESKARELYFLRGTFQFGAPAAPQPEFFAQDKNKKLVPMVLMRDALYKLYKDPKTKDQAVELFLDRFGERAMYATGAKTLGESFGQQFTQKAYDWERTHSGIVDKYPLSFPEFAPRSKPGETLSWDAWLHAVTTGQRTTVKPKDMVMRVSNVLGSMWYDQVRKKIGLGPGDPGTRSQQLFLAEKRNQIHDVYPGFRRVVTDDTRVPSVIEELVDASKDPEVYRSNPALADVLHDYVQYRQSAIGFVKANGGGGDFNRPGYASAAQWADVRQKLRDKAAELAKQVPQFGVLWDDTFAREMAED